MERIANDEVCVCRSEDGREFELGFPGEGPAVTGGRGLFDMMVALGSRHQWGIAPEAQAGAVKKEGGTLVARYEKLRHGGACLGVGPQVCLKRFSGSKIRCKREGDRDVATVASCAVEGSIATWGRFLGLADNAGVGTGLPCGREAQNEDWVKAPQSRFPAPKIAPHAPKIAKTGPQVPTVATKAVVRP